MKEIVKFDECGAKKPSIPYGIGSSKQGCGEGEWIQQKKQKYKIGKLGEYITNKTHFPANFVV